MGVKISPTASSSGAIETVLDAARRRAGKSGQHEANPARWRGHLDKLLASVNEARSPCGNAVRRPAGIDARLRQRDAMSALALEFTILTAARTSEALGARWDDRL